MTRPETSPPLHGAAVLVPRTIAGVLNWAIWIAFAVELVVMLAVVPDKWRWLRSHPLEVVIVLLTPPFVPSSLQALRALRVLRLLRLLRLAQLTRRTFSLRQRSPHPGPWFSRDHSWSPCCL